MEGQGSSFIPKNSNRVSTVRTRGTHRIYVLSYVSYIVFFGTLFAVAGVFLYAASVNRSVMAVKDQLTTERSRFSTSEIESIKLLDARLTNAEKLVNESAAPSKIFEDLETVVADNVRFSAMEYKYLPNGQFELALTGQAEELNEVIWQQELLQNANVLKDAVVSKYDYSVQGESSESAVSGDATLTFIITETKPTSLISYTPEPTLGEDASMTEGGEALIDDEELGDEDQGAIATTTVENGT
ncbi:hypothetical protein A2837_02365 [Candidatus Kaiserbacteria bacterium RIFCSPHIGHO2_01_FULL_46_22]|uniref:Fimbrial assembly protein n=1 Tax=Candidatus Kaiserbacteria bacterium RIFCSPHIGHO2_01_FULL_46_22 TaxID=1798475 RepID=A0A1F6BX38_9BACT|nr:MAG: hypothetical protein A2837_02365 [Candidatus Kaiserbacteria bacterium RIFCSPHIGHO2_01_FULL_46_22]